ncbi:MAG TPA: hypothetical protein VFA05_10170 [Gaiellaceae bacterium]|nr:hypothetical protein [Gaiellaceae bacterium]
MRRLALLGALASLAAACGSGKPAATLADVAPRSTSAVLDVARAPTTRALALSAAGSTLRRAIASTSWARFAPRAQVAILPQGPVAYLLPKDRKAFERALDARRLLHAHVRGWEAFTPNVAALAAAEHAKRTLRSDAWFARASQAAPGHADAVLLARGWQVLSVSGDAFGVTRPGGGRAAPVAGEAAIPADAVAASAWHDAARVLRGLPVGAQLRAGLGLTLPDLAAAAPGDAVFYARPGVPLPGLTLLADGGTLRAAARLVHDLDREAPPPLPATVDGHTLEDVAFSALDIYYGRVGRTLVLTNDPGATLVKAGRRLRPAGLPAGVVGWTWVDVPRALAELRTLASLAGTSVSESFVRRFAGLRTVLEYETAGHGLRTSTIVAR